MAKKKRLLFDLMEEEYDSFVEEAESQGMTKIELFREIWTSYIEKPNIKLNKNAGLGEQCRYHYLTLLDAINLMLKDINNGGEICGNDRQKSWDIWVNRLHEIADLLQANPLDISDEEYKLPKNPNWLKKPSEFLNAKIKNDCNVEKHND